jgi:hypothetical protein
MDIVAESASRPTLLADPTVVHPVAANRRQLEAHARTSGAAARRREDAKAQKYGEAARSLGMPFLPLVVETFGRMGAAATGFVQKLATEKARGVPSREDRQQADQYLRQRLLARWYRTISCALQRGNALILRANLVAAREASQRGGGRRTPAMDLHLNDLPA